MKHLIVFLLSLCLLLTSFTSQAQEAKYKVIQGLGYLHTQATMIIEHWKTHPLNHKPMDAHEAVLQEHILKEIDHDEEWAEYMMVEDNVLNHFADHIDDKVKIAIEENLNFYHRVIRLLHDPDKLTEKWEDLKKELETAEKKLYGLIYPALCK